MLDAHAEQVKHDRETLELAKDVLRPRRWGQLSIEQRKELTKRIRPEMTDRELFQTFRAVMKTE